MIRALVVLVAVPAVLACRPSAPDPEEAEAPPPALAAAPSPTAAAAPAAAPAPPLLPGADEEQAGGRALSWWRERLTTLRKDGPPELYELALQRARANGLRVTVGAAAVEVQAAPEPQAVAP